MHDEIIEYDLVGFIPVDKLSDQKAYRLMLPVRFSYPHSKFRIRLLRRNRIRIGALDRTPCLTEVDIPK